MGLEQRIVSKEVDIEDHLDNKSVKDRSKPEVEDDDEVQRTYEQKLTNLRVLE